MATYLEKAIKLVNLLIQNMVDCSHRQKTIKLKWASTTTNYVEWVYGLRELLLKQNGDKPALQTLFDIFNPIFDLKVQNYRQFFNGAKNRKKIEHPTIFDVQKQLLSKRKEKIG